MGLDTSFLSRYLGGVDPREMSALETLLESCTAEVEGITGRRFRAADDLTEYLDGNGQRTLELRTPVYNDGLVGISVGILGSWTTLAQEVDYFIDRDPKLGTQSLVVLTTRRWPVGIRNVSAVYVGGYGASGLNPPAEIATLIADLVGIRYRERVGSTAGTSPGEIPKHLQAIIDRWTYMEAVEQPRLVRA